MANVPLFVLPIAPSGGKFVVTQPAPKVYLITFDSPPDNRMTPAFCKTFLLALDLIEHKLPKGVVISTSAIAKFYSNGLDYESAIKTKNFFQDSAYPLWRRLLTYPMPTIAIINGHAFAAGLMTAMMHDYRFMNPHKGFVCLNELDFGAPMKPPMLSIFRQKLPRPDAYRSMVLESKRFTALEALKEGIVDGLGGLDEAAALIKESRLVGRADSGVYGVLKEEMWRETVAYLDMPAEEDENQTSIRARKTQERKLEGKKIADAWEAQSRNGRTKL